jgi:aminopeptidase N
MRLTLLLALVLLAAPAPRTQVMPAGADIESCAHARAAIVHNAAGPMARSEASPEFDAHFYDLRLHLDFPRQRIVGTVRAEGRITGQPLRTLRLDLVATLAVTAVRGGDGQPLAFTRTGDVLAIDLGSSLPVGSPIAVEIDYGGQPQATGFGGLVFTTVGGQPAAWTLSQPYASRAWWPTRDHPSDKADSVRVSVTVPAGLRVGSNGLLEMETTAGDQTTYRWVHRYPVATYLVSFAAGPYAAFEQTYVRPDSLAAEFGPLALPILHYRYQASGTATLPAGWAEAVDMMPVFEHWFGPYPFGSEKYGHKQFTWGGGMEHQTMSSMGGTSALLTAHELAHQWFGNAITTRTWPHLWLNEGFATYGEMLYWEARPDRYPGRYDAALDGNLIRARRAPGTLVVADTLSVANLFNSDRVYSKGAVVLHMLRRMIGNEAFRAALRGYMTSPELRYGTAVTADFQRHAEQASGRDLSTFFRQWVTEGTGYPEYVVRWSVAEQEAEYEVTVVVEQRQTASASNLGVFEMPVTIQIQTPEGPRRFRVLNDRRVQTYTFVVATEPTGVVFDPDVDLLRNDPVVVLRGDEPVGLPTETALVATFPNPAGRTLWLRYALVTAQPVRLALYDVAGREVLAHDLGVQAVGWHSEKIDVGTLAAGAYILRLEAGETLSARRVVITR